MGIEKVIEDEVSPRLDDIGSELNSIRACLEDIVAKLDTLVVVLARREKMF